MKVKKIFIQAFRCFVKADIDFSKGDTCANLVALQAPNGFGKTSLLDAIEFGMTNRIERFEKANYKEDNVVDKKLRDKHSFLHNKERLDLPIKIKICLEDGQVIDKCYDEKTANLFGRNKCLENEYFRSVILSQDWFSEFISTTDPELRYETFFKYFYEGEDLVQYRISIKQKWNELNSSKTEIESKINELNAVLSKSVPDNVRQEYEKQLAKLAEKGIVIPKLETSDKEELKNCMFFLKSKSVAVNNEQESLSDLIAKTYNVLNGQTEYLSLSGMSHVIDVIKSERCELHARLNMLAKQKNLGQLKRNLENNEKLREPLLKEKDTLLSGLRHIEELLLIFSRLVKIENEDSQRQEEIKKLKEFLSKCEQSIGSISDKYNESQKHYGMLTNQIKNLDKDFTEYQRILQDIKDLHGNLTKANTELGGLRKGKLALDGRYELLLKLKREVDLLSLSEDTVFLDEYRQDIISLKKDCDTLSEIENKINQIKSLIEGQQVYKDEIKRLVIDAQNIQTVLKDGICPVCGYDYKSSTALLEKIASNTILDESIKVQLKQKQQLLDQQKSLLEARSKKQGNLVDKINSALELNKKNIDDAIKKINLQESIVVKANETIKQKSDLISKWKADFGDLEFKQIRELYLSRQEFLKADVQNYKESLDKERGKMQDTKNAISEKEKQITLLANKYLQVTSSINYQKLSTKMKSELRSEGFSENVWKQQLGVLTDKIAVYDGRISQCKAEISKFEVEGIHFEEQESTTLAIENIKIEIDKNKDNLHQTLSYLKEQCSIDELNVPQIEQYDDIEKIKSVIFAAQRSNNEKSKSIKALQNDLDVLDVLMSKVWSFMEYDESLKRKKQLVLYVEKIESSMTQIEVEVKALEDYVEQYVENFFDLDLINRLYNIIDPHPEYKHIKFACDFSNIKPKLSVMMEQEQNDSDRIVPNLYFSTAQVNILSFCIFLAKALNAKNDNGDSIDCIFIDDPIQSLDDINILSLIDLLRNIAFRNKKQIILTTHDKNFYELLKRKMPSNLFNSKFLKLYERGKVMEDKVV